MGLSVVGRVLGRVVGHVCVESVAGHLSLVRFVCLKRPSALSVALADLRLPRRVKALSWVVGRLGHSLLLGILVHHLPLKVVEVLGVGRHQRRVLLGVATRHFLK